jgi:hypothetical protein
MKFFKGERVVFSEEILTTQAAYYGDYRGHTFVVDRVGRGGRYGLRCEDDPTVVVDGMVHDVDLVRLEAPKPSTNAVMAYEDVFEALNDAIRARAEQASLALASAFGLKTNLVRDDMVWDEYAWRVETDSRDRSGLEPVCVAFTLADPLERGEDVEEGAYAITVEVTGEGGLFLGATETEYSTDLNLLKTQLQEVYDHSIVAAVNESPRKTVTPRARHTKV